MVERRGGGRLGTTVGFKGLLGGWCYIKVSRLPCIT